MLIPQLASSQHGVGHSATEASARNNSRRTRLRQSARTQFTLRVSGPGGSNTLTRTNYVTVSDADTLYVAPTGQDAANDCADSTAPCATVQHAVDMARPGNEIRVAAGTYTDVSARPRNDTLTTGVVTQVVYISKTVTIRGGYTTTNWIVPNPDGQPSTLDAGGQGRALYITGNINPAIQGLRITGGDATGLGGGAYDEDAGGGIYVFNAPTTINDNVVFTNMAHDGEGFIS